MWKENGNRLTIVATVGKSTFVNSRMILYVDNIKKIVLDGFVKKEIECKNKFAQLNVTAKVHPLNLKPGDIIKFDAMIKITGKGRVVLMSPNHITVIRRAADNRDLPSEKQIKYARAIAQELELELDDDIGRKEISAFITENIEEYKKRKSD